MASMKVHQFARAFWDHEPRSLDCNRSRPLLPKLPNSHTNPIATFYLKNFIKPESGPRKPESSPDHKKDSPQVETHPGGTRWNPTQEQIGILEQLYRSGMRTPNAQQIEWITEQLGKFGKIEGKNVFYWFQNHKARERQKQKRNSLGLTSHGPRTPTSIATITSETAKVVERGEDSPNKRKSRSWSFEFECLEMEKQSRSSCKEEGEYTTLELFPLHPEGR